MAKKQLIEKMVSIDKIDEPKGIVRLEIDQGELRDLADSINALGLMQAILVRPDGERFEIIYGHRRYLACKLLGMKQIRATVKALTNEEAAMMRATENIERVDISPIEEAAVYQDLYKTHGMRVDKIALKMGKSAGIIKRRMDLLRMPPCLQQAIHKKEISYSVGEVLWSLGELPDIEYYLAFAIENGAARSTVVQWVKDAADKKRRKASTGEGGAGWQSPMESRPVYIACDLCSGAMEIGEEKVLRTCPACTAVIKKAVEEKTT